MPRRVKAPDERRRDLIACARELFYTKGYESTSVRDIVDKAGVAKGTFYYYFDSKLSIMEAMVDDLVAQSMALLHEIVADETSPALVKWSRAFREVGAWKSERKTELLAMLHAMQVDENLPLHYKIQTRAVQLLAPEFAKIVAQGVEEGVFDTEYVEESAGITLSIFLSLSDTIYAIILNPDRYQDPAGLLRRKFASVETAVERVLGAPAGSLYLVDDQSLETWVAD